MKILRTYFLKEFTAPFLLSLGVLTFIMLLGYLVQIADLVINKGINLPSVIKLFLTMVPFLLTYTIPASALGGVLFSLARMASDNEILAIKASGINILRLLTPLFVVGVILSLVLFIFNDRVVPYAHYMRRKILIDVGVRNPTAALEPGVFINSFERYTLFIYRIEQNRLFNVRIYEPQGEGKPPRTIVAKEGEFISIPEKGIVKLKLINGTADEPDPNNPLQFYKLNFKVYFMTLNATQAQKKQEINKKPKDMTIDELKKEIRRLNKEGINSSPLIAQIHEKIATALSPFLFILLGASLSVIVRLRQKGLNFLLAVLIIMPYYVLLTGLEAIALQGNINPILAMWLPNALYLAIGLPLIFKVCVY